MCVPMYTCKIIEKKKKKSTNIQQHKIKLSFTAQNKYRIFIFLLHPFGFLHANAFYVIWKAFTLFACNGNANDTRWLSFCWNISYFSSSSRLSSLFHSFSGRFSANMQRPMIDLRKMIDGEITTTYDKIFHNKIIAIFVVIISFWNLFCFFFEK